MQFKRQITLFSAVVILLSVALGLCPAHSAQLNAQIKLAQAPAPPMPPPATAPQVATAPALPPGNSPASPPSETNLKDDQGNPLMQIQFDNIELRDFIRFASNTMGKNFVYDEATVKGKVTILSPRNLTKDEVYRVFEGVLNFYGFAIVNTPEALKIVKIAEAKSMAIESLDKQSIVDLPPDEHITTLVYALEYLDGAIMVGILRPLMAKEAYLVSVPATNSLIMIDTLANLQRLRKLIVDIDLPISKQLSSIDIYNVQHTNAAELAKVLQALLAEGKKAQTPKDKIFITSYVPTNSLLVSAPAEDMKEIRRIIQEIDTFRPQVLVEAAIIEVSMTKGDEVGVEWLTGGKTGSGGLVGGVVNSTGNLLAVGTAVMKSDPAAIGSALKSGFNIGVLGPSISFNGTSFPSVAAFMRALTSEDRVNIISTPQILTMNNEEAEILVGENRPYLTSTRLDSAGNPINTFDYRDVGVKLKVKPYINKDGFVNLTILQEVTKITVGTDTATGTQTPTTLKRSTKTTVGVKDTQTIVISGLISDDSTDHREGIPFLSSLPIVGNLFGVKRQNYDKTNLLVFITPRIVYSTEALEQLTKEKQQKGKEDQANTLKADPNGK